MDLSSLGCFLYVVHPVSWPPQEQAGPHVPDSVPLALEGSLETLIVPMTSTQATTWIAHLCKWVTLT